MRFLSLFAGIGGIDLGLERAGMTCVGQVEIDPFCRKVLQKHWPHVWRHDDVRTLTAEMIHEHCGRVDLIAGGFPCQDISMCGDWAGIDGDRSGLWREMVRIIRDIRPRFALVENVSALLVPDDGEPAAMGRVLGDLATIGYDAEWESLPASAFGAYHERDRVFVVAYASGVDGGSHDLLEARREWGPSLQSGRFSCVAMATRGQQQNTRLRFEPGLDRLVRRVPASMDRLKSVGNSVYPAVAEWIGRRIMRCDQTLNPPVSAKSATSDLRGRWIT